MSMGILFAMTSFAQQGFQYTQYQFNMLAYNPAYTGAREAISITSIYRHQWTEFEGAPRTASVNVHSPLKNDRVAVGLQFSSDQHGLSSFSSVEASYAYRMPMGSGKLSLALDGGATFFRLRAGDALIENPNDPSLLSTSVNKTYPTIGAGAFYSSSKAFAGLSVNNFLANRLNSFKNTAIQTDPSRTERHIYATAGYLLDVSGAVKVRPTVLLSYTQANSVNWEANASLLMLDKLWIGAGIRSAGGYTGNIQFNATPQLRFGYAYDYITSDLGGVSTGTHEMLIGFDLDYSNKNVVSPRQITPVIL